MDYLLVFPERAGDLFNALLEHILISGVAVILGCMFAIPLAIFLNKTPIQWIKSLAFTITNVFQTIPSLALLAILIPLLGIGFVPAVTALFLYSLLPILRNTYAAFESIDPEIIESAKGMGYSAVQRLFQIELFIAVPYIMSGIRLTTIYIISWATLATLIGAGGLGQLIVGGLGVYNKPLILAAAVLSMTLALFTDFVLGRIEKRISTRVKKV